MRIVAALLFAIASANCFAADPNQCKLNLPFGTPQSAKNNVTLICREGYALEHDNVAKIPTWVAYVLTPQSAVGCAARTASFKAEPLLERGNRAELKDYAKSGYDIGHMANSADMRSSALLSEESNILSNAAPQLPALNRAAWKSLEVRTRGWASGRGDNILIYVGPIYSLRGSTTIGKSAVVVPRAFYKVLVDQKTLETMAFIYPQEASRASPNVFKTSIAEVQKQTGIVFPLPKGAVLNGSVWPTMSAGPKVCAIN